jgi:hypothetical protein
MFLNDTKKVLSVAAAILIAGVASVELTRQPAQANTALVQGGAAGYAGARVDTAFDIAAKPTVTVASLPVAIKGNLPPVGCRGPLRAEIADECLDAAAEVPAIVVETRIGDATSVLTRVVGYQLAGF